MERKKTTVFRRGDDNYHTYRIPALVITKEGTLLAFCEGRQDGPDDFDDIDVVLKRSLDGGESWLPMQILWDEGSDSLGNLSPVVDRDTGTVWMLVNNKTRDRIYVMRSEDDGRTWSVPEEITEQVIASPELSACTPNPGHGIQLQSGRLLYPARTRKGCYAYAIYTDDLGESWHAGGLTGIGMNESMAVELADGRVYMTMRQYRLPEGTDRGETKYDGWWKRELIDTFSWTPQERAAMAGEGRNRHVPRRASAWSSDGGQTWSDVQFDSALICPLCLASIVGLRDGEAGSNEAVIFVNPASVERNNLTVRLSGDGCRSWSAEKSLHQGPSAYSDLTVLPDQTIGCLFEGGASSPYETLIFSRFSLAWLKGASLR